MMFIWIEKIETAHILAWSIPLSAKVSTESRISGADATNDKRMCVMEGLMERWTFMIKSGICNKIIIFIYEKQCKRDKKIRNRIPNRKRS